MPTFFVIKELDAGYCWMNFEFNDFVYDYATDVHSIPEEYIDNIEALPESQKVEITLFEDREIVSEDWYHILLRYAA